MLVLDQLLALQKTSTTVATKPPPKVKVKEVKISTSKYGQARTEATRLAYQKVMMGKGWLKKKDIETALSRRTNGSQYFLEKLMTLEIIKRRNFGGSLQYSPCWGFEYQWVQGLPTGSD